VKKSKKHKHDRDIMTSEHEYPHQKGEAVTDRDLREDVTTHPEAYAHPALQEHIDKYLERRDRMTMSGDERIEEVAGALGEMQHDVATEIGQEDGAPDVIAATDHILLRDVETRVGDNSRPSPDQTLGLFTAAALEADGQRLSSDKNPIHQLEEDSPELVTQGIGRLQELDAHLPDSQHLAAEVLVQEIANTSPEQPTMGEEESANWLAKKDLRGIGGTMRMNKLLGDVDAIPALSPNVASELLQQVAADEKRSDFTKVLSRFPDAASEDLKQAMYRHPAEMSTLVADRPELARFMSDQHVITELAQRSVIDLCDDAETDTLRESIIHHSSVLSDPNSADWARNTSRALVNLNAFEIGFGDVRAGGVNYNSSFDPSDNVIGDLEIPTASILPTVSAEQAVLTSKRFEDMDSDEKTMVLKEGIDVEEARKLSLQDLKPEYQELVVASTLIRAHNTTHDPEVQHATSERNKTLSESGQFLHEGDFVHTTTVYAIDNILKNGFVCGELIGENAVNDAYPLNTDFNRVEPDEIRDGSFNEKIRAATAGFHDANNADSRVTFILPAEGRQFTDRGADARKGDHKHRLVFGAVAATEAGGIVLAGGQSEVARQTEAHVLQSVLSQETYYPVIDRDGQVILTAEEFESKKSERLDSLLARGALSINTEINSEPAIETAPQEETSPPEWDANNLVF
jgi:hypothetical protein